MQPTNLTESKKATPIPGIGSLLHACYQPVNWAMSAIFTTDPGRRQPS